MWKIPLVAPKERAGGVLLFVEKTIGSFLLVETGGVWSLIGEKEIGSFLLVERAGGVL